MLSNLIGIWGLSAKVEQTGQNRPLLEAVIRFAVSAKKRASKPTCNHDYKMCFYRENDRVLALNNVDNHVRMEVFKIISEMVT